MTTQQPFNPPSLPTTIEEVGPFFNAHYLITDILLKEGGHETGVLLLDKDNQDSPDAIPGVGTLTKLQIQYSPDPFIGLIIESYTLSRNQFLSGRSNGAWSESMIRPTGTMGYVGFQNVATFAKVSRSALKLAYSDPWLKKKGE